MTHLSLAPVLSTLLLLATGSAQDLPPSGTFGLEIFGLTDASGAASLQILSVIGQPARLTSLPAPPSRWLHRRRHMGAREAEITYAATNAGPVLFVPTGDRTTNGGLTELDFRGTSLITHLTTNAPAGYDLLLLPSHGYVVHASDNGQGQTVVETFYFGSPGSAPFRAGSLVLAGAPAAGVSRMHVASGETHALVATTDGIHVLAVGPLANPLTFQILVSTLPRSPVTNVAAFTRGAAPHFAVMASDFVGTRPADTAVVAFDLQGQPTVTPMGNVPNTNPPKPWVPAAGFQTPAVVEQGGIAFVCFLLREREPGTFFTKPAGVAVLGFGMPNDPTFAVVPTLPAAGEPFGEVAVHGTRVAFMTSGDPAWWPIPAGGSERLNLLYTPLDPLGAATVGGVIGSAGPLGGRIGTEVTDRPLWSRDGRTLFVTTVNFPGAPNPGIAGSEVLAVPDDRVLSEASDPMQTLLRLGDQTTERAYGLPTVFAPRDLPAAAFGNFTLFGQSTQTTVNGVLIPHLTPGWLGAATPTPSRLRRDTNIPLFPAIPPRTFDDFLGSVVAPPITYGARRSSFNLFARGTAILLAYQVQIADDAVLYQATGFNTAGFGPQLPVVPIALPTGSRASTEILSL